MLGVSVGKYIRIELRAVPCEFVTEFNVSRPAIIGGLLIGEGALAMTQCKLKKHRWYKKILKNNDPLVISAGWRRFQTIPVGMHNRCVLSFDCLVAVLAY